MFSSMSAYPLPKLVWVPRGMTYNDSHAGYVDRGIWGVRQSRWCTTVAWEVILANLSFQLKHRQFPVVPSGISHRVQGSTPPRWTCRHRPSGLGPLSCIVGECMRRSPWSDKQLKRQPAGQERGHPISVDKVSNSSKPSTSKRFR